MIWCCSSYAVAVGAEDTATGWTAETAGASTLVATADNVAEATLEDTVADAGAEATLNIWDSQQMLEQ